MSRTRHARRAKIPATSATRALPLLRAWCKRHEHTTMDVARMLCRSWTYTERLLAGHVRPSVDDAHVLYEKADVPFDAWFPFPTKRAA